MTFSLGGTHVRVTFAAVLLSAFCIVAGEGKTLLFALLSLSVHEAAHAVAAYNLGCPVSEVTLWPFGAVMRLDRLFLSDRNERIVAAAGPVGSLAFAGMLKLAGLVLPASEWSDALVGANLLIALFNLLPAFPLDGGRIFRSLLLKTLRERTARTLMLVMTALGALGMLVLGAVLASKGFTAWSLFLIPPVLVVSAFREWRVPETGVVARVTERQGRLRTGSAEKAQIVVLSENASVGEALSVLSASRFTFVRVLSPGGFFELDARAILSAAAKSGMQAPLKTVILRLTVWK